MTQLDFFQSLEAKIALSYEEGINLETAEKLSAEFLMGQLKVSEELRVKDLDSRMRKSGLKAIRAAVYMEAATKGDKKPSDVMLQAIVDMDQIVTDQQNSFDEAEVERDNLERLYNVFQQAHVYYRQISRGSMG